MQVLLVYLHVYDYIITIVVKEQELRTWIERLGVGMLKESEWVRGVDIQLSTHIWNSKYQCFLKNKIRGQEPMFRNGPSKIIVTIIYFCISENL